MKNHLCRKPLFFSKNTRVSELKFSCLALGVLSALMPLATSAQTGELTGDFTTEMYKSPDMVVIANLIVGDTRLGGLSVTQGKPFPSLAKIHSVILGRSGSGMGKVTVSGQGSTLALRKEFHVGAAGQGSLEVLNEGTVSDSSASIGRDVGSVGEATISGLGSTWTNTDTLNIGESGSGTLKIADGAAVFANQGTIGLNQGSTGKVTVLGQNTTWENSGSLVVGAAGSGTLAIQRGGHVSNSAGYVGDMEGGRGAVLVSGNGSTWTNNGRLTVGMYGSGALNIEYGGNVFSDGAQIAANAGSSGEVIVEGLESAWTNAGELSVGAGGNGKLSVVVGAKLNSDSAFIGWKDSVGEVLVQDGTSTWANTGTITVGEAGVGILTINEAGTVSAKNLVIAAEAGSRGVLNIGAAAGDNPANPGRLLNVAGVSFGDPANPSGGGDGRIVFNHSYTGDNYRFDAPISGKGRIDVYNGKTVLTAHNTYTGPTTIYGGTLQADTENIFADSSDIVINGGTLNLHGNNQLVHRLAGTGGTILLNGAALTASNTTVSDNTEFAGSIADGDLAGGTLLKTGDGTLALSGDNTFTGLTTIQSGTLQIGNDKINGTLAGDIANQGTLIFNGGKVSAYGGVLSGSGTFLKKGNGTYFLGGNGSSQGRVEVQQGVLAFAQADPFTVTGDYTTQTGAGTSIVGYNGAALDVRGTFTQQADSQLKIALGTAPTITAERAVLDGYLLVQGFAEGPTPVKATDVTNGQRFTLLHTTDGISGNFVNQPLPHPQLDYLLSGGNISADGKDYKLGFALAWTEGGAANGTGSFTLDEHTAFDVDIALGDQTGVFASGWDGRSLTKNGAGLLELSAVNTYTGATTVNGGVLQAGAANAFADSSNVVVNGGTLDLHGNNQLAQRLSGTGGSILLNGAMLTAHNASAVDSSTFAGTLADGVTVGGAFVKTGDGTLILNGDSTFSGLATIRGGTLQIGDGGISGSLKGDIANQHSLIFNRSDASTYGGAISGAGNFIKQGNGTLTLTGNSIYTGTTSIDAGVLALNSSADLATSASTDLTKSGATLDISRAGDAGAHVQNLSGVAGSRLILGGKQLTVSNNKDSIFAGDIDESTGGLIKNGNASLLLSGRTSYTGTTQLNHGTLVLDGSHGGAQLTSNVVGQSGTKLSLLHGASLTGSIDPTDVTIDPASRWIITANSTVNTLTLGGEAQFAVPAQPMTVGRTLTVHQLVGQGGTLGLYTALGNAGSVSDQLLISGSASGLTHLQIQNAGGLGDLTTGNGITVVHALNGATTTSDAFDLGHRVLAGPYEYTLQRGGIGAANDWFLVNHASVGDTVTDQPPTPVGVLPDYRAETSLYSDLGSQGLRYGEAVLGSLRERVGGQVDLATSNDRYLWGRIIGQTDRADGSRRGIYDHNIRSQTGLSALQAGGDLWVAGNGSQRSSVGVYGAIGQSRTTVEHVDMNAVPSRAGTDQFTAYSVGAYGTWLDGRGAYVDAVLQGSHYDITSQSRNGLRLLAHSNAWAVSVEGGKRFELAPSWNVEPQAQVVYQSLDISDTRDQVSDVRFDRASSALFRLGARLSKTLTAAGSVPASAWLSLDMLRNSAGSTRTRFATATQGDVPFANDHPGTRVALRTGIDTRVGENVWLNARLGMERSVDASHLTSFNGQLGVKVAF